MEEKLADRAKKFLAQRKQEKAKSQPSACTYRIPFFHFCFA